MLDFKVQLALGDQELTEAEWRELMAGEEGLVLLRGQWVEVDRDKLTEALDHWKQVEQQAADGLSFIDGMRLLAGAPRDLADDAERGDAAARVVVCPCGQVARGTCSPTCGAPKTCGTWRPGTGLQATLREYQETGVNWLWFLSSLGLGACLADDMGLGKTIQVLALLLVLKKQKASKPSLLVLPASLVANWKAEMSRFAPTLRVQFVHPSRNGQGRVGPDGRGPGQGPAEHRRRADNLRHAAASAVAARSRLATGCAGRGSGDQEPGGAADEGRQTARRPKPESR